MRVLLIGIILVLCLLNSLLGCGTLSSRTQRESELNSSTPIQQTETPVIDKDEWVVVSIIAASDSVAVAEASSKMQIQNLAMWDDEYYRVSAENSVEYIDYSGNINTIPDGVSRIGTEPSKQVFVKLLKLCSDSSLMESCLANHGVKDVPKEMMLISVIGQPLVMRMDCDNAVWFITIDTQDDSGIGSFVDGYYLRVYSQQEYIELMQPQQITVFVNGITVSSCDAMRFGDQMKVPVVCILKQFDENAQLKKDDDRLTLLLNNNEYSIVPDEHRMTLGNSGRNIIEIPPGCFGFCKVSGDELYVDAAALSDILRLVNARAVFDRENLHLLIEAANER